MSERNRDIAELWFIQGYIRGWKNSERRIHGDFAYGELQGDFEYIFNTGKYEKLVRTKKNKEDSILDKIFIEK